MNWVIKENVDNEFVSTLSKELNISPILSSMLVKRDIKTFDQAKTFFRPNFEMLHDPFLMKDMSIAVERIQKAVEKKCPYIFVSDSGGMRMMTNMLSLMHMTRMTIAINELKKQNLPYIVVLTDPTAGGITASYAMLGDIHLAEPGALIAFAGARVIQGTVREELPDGFQRSEYLEKTGFVDLIVERKDLREKIGTLLSILLKKNSAINTKINETTEDSRTLTKAAS